MQLSLFFIKNKMRDISVLPDGIYTDITDEEYFADRNRVNCSSLKTVIQNEGATVFLNQKREVTAAMRIGTAFHTLVLEPEKFNDRFVVIPKVSFATKEGKLIKEKYADCVFLNDKERTSDEGRQIVINEEDYDELLKLKNGLLYDFDGAELEAKRLLDQSGDCECVVLFTHLNIPCKCKIDKFLKESLHILDVKTCQSSKVEDFQKTVFDYGYFIQAAFYKLAFWCLAEITVKFSFLAVEKTEDVYLSQVFNTDEWDGAGQALIDFYLPIAYKAMQDKKYSGYMKQDRNKNMSIPVPGWIDRKLQVMMGA